MTTKPNIHTVSWCAPADEEVCLCAIGARTPLGYSASASAAAVRAAISAVTLHPFFVDKADEPMALARDPELDPDIGIAARMEHMLISATTDVLASHSLSLAERQVQCWIGLPEQRPGLPDDIQCFVSKAFSSVFGLPPSAVHVLSHGHAAGLMAIQIAAEKISIGETEFCLAAAVDSYHNFDTLSWLDRNGRLMSSKNRNGFPPGEAAAACLLARRSVAEHYGLPILARIIAASTTAEPHAIHSSEVCLGHGLSAALNGVISCLQHTREPITATYCDLNGERYRNEEFLYTLLRVQDAFVDAHDYHSPADCWGDAGAASGLLFACLAIASSQRGYAKGFYPLLWTSSESGNRTAVILRLNES